MIQPKQWGNWLKVFALMMIFTLVQIPISQYAFGGSAAAEVQEKTILHETKEEVIEEEVIKEKVNDEIITEDNTVQNIIQKDKKPVYLTIDDGPGTVSDEFLDILAGYGVEATFFLLEPRVRAYPEEVRRMVIEGHRLGLHGVTHDVRKFYDSSESVVRELNKTMAALREVTGLECLLARTPYGSAPYLSQDQDQAAAKAGYKLWDWNVDSRDWYYRDEEYVRSTLEQVQKINDAGAEPVILIHELKSTAKYLPQLIEELLAQGYEFLPLEVNAPPVRLL